VRGLMKRTLELALVRSGAARAFRRASGTDRVVLAYHNVVPDGHGAMGDSSLHLPLSNFNGQLDLLSATHAIVPLREFLDADRRGGKPLAAITFDDAYRGAVELGVQELLRRDLPCTVFVPPGLLGCEGFWWDRVADPERGAVSPDFLRLAFRELGGRQDSILERASSLGFLHDPLPELYRPASESALEALIGDPLVTLGSHTWSHVHLPSVPRSEAQEELRRPLTWLRERSSPGPFFLSYPYGAFEENLEGTVREAGYEAAFLVQGGATQPQAVRRNPLAIPRLNVPRGVSPEGFQARLCGAWPG
jgi:peptidoglycan/xylan/chitin deacetylase (PgdA/CDA1 family)